MPELSLPNPEHLLLRRDGWRLHVTLNRPDVRNAMSFAMVHEIVAVFDAIADRRDVRAVVLRGAGGHFCAGGDIKDMAGARNQKPGDDGIDPMAKANRSFGTMLQRIEASPQAVIAVCEGAVMGGGFGLACVSDVAIAVQGAKFRLPETGLGITPAQIAPFIVRRIGLTQARRLAVTGGKLSAGQAVALGLAHEVVQDESQLDERLEAVLSEVGRCAPNAVALTKKLVLAVGQKPLDEVLDDAAADFAVAARGPEAMEGMAAFLQKKTPSWAEERK